MSFQHTLHIPVMGTCFTLDSPIKVAPFGIDSAISLVDDDLIDAVRGYYEGEGHVPIGKKETDSKARRITAYLNLVNQKVNERVKEIRQQEFEPGTELTKYFRMLPSSPQKLENKLREQVIPGSIDTNMMVTLNGAMEAVKGFAESDLNSALILSAGMVPQVYSYIGEFEDFSPQGGKEPKKKIILKVSDWRSAIIQGKFLAKKGILVKEYRIESGLNCGGHAFATEGMLLGPVLDEFKQRKQELINFLYPIYAQALEKKGIKAPDIKYTPRITVQGGITTGNENSFLLNQYGVDGTGIATPFLLVPEAASVDIITLGLLKAAKEKDIRMSKSSPLGITFQNLMTSLSEDRRRQLINEGKPGTPCVRGYLKNNTEFTGTPICTASRQYQSLKSEELQSQFSSGKITNIEFKESYEETLSKSCICYQLGDSMWILYNLEKKGGKYPAICPGPNIADFDERHTLEEMMGHFYGGKQLVTASKNMFIRELDLYIDNLENKKGNVDKNYIPNLFNGIGYYEGIARKIHPDERELFLRDLNASKIRLEELQKKIK